MIYNFNFTGPGGLIINLASCAGLTHTKYHDSLAYWISKHAVVTITRNLGGPAIVKKTGIKVSTWRHIGQCPHVSCVSACRPVPLVCRDCHRGPDNQEDGDGQESNQVCLCWAGRRGFWTGGKRAKVWEQACGTRWLTTCIFSHNHCTCTRVHRSGGLIAVLPNTPLVYYPDILQETGLIVYLLSKVLQIFGCETSTPALQGLVIMGMMIIMSYLMHILFGYLGM